MNIKMLLSAFFVCALSVFSYSQDTAKEKTVINSESREEDSVRINMEPQRVEQDAHVLFYKNIKRLYGKQNKLVYIRDESPLNYSEIGFRFYKTFLHKFSPMTGAGISLLSQEKDYLQPGVPATQEQIKEICKRTKSNYYISVLTESGKQKMNEVLGADDCGFSGIPQSDGSVLYIIYGKVNEEVGRVVVKKNSEAEVPVVIKGNEYKVRINLSNAADDVYCYVKFQIFDKNDVCIHNSQRFQEMFLGGSHFRDESADPLITVKLFNAEGKELCKRYSRIFGTDDERPAEWILEVMLKEFPDFPRSHEQAIYFDTFRGLYMKTKELFSDSDGIKIIPSKESLKSMQKNKMPYEKITVDGIKAVCHDANADYFCVLSLDKSKDVDMTNNPKLPFPYSISVEKDMKVDAEGMNYRFTFSYMKDSKWIDNYELSYSSGKIMRASLEYANTMEVMRDVEGGPFYWKIKLEMPNEKNKLSYPLVFSILENKNHEVVSAGSLQIYGYKVTYFANQNHKYDVFCTLIDSSGNLVKRAVIPLSGTNKIDAVSEELKKFVEMEVDTVPEELKKFLEKETGNSQIPFNNNVLLCAMWNELYDEFWSLYAKEKTDEK